MVHYPVKGGSLINVVAILRDDWNEPGWNEPAHHHDILDRFGAGVWQKSVRELIVDAPRWRKWALFDTPSLRQWGKGPVTLLGDAAHPMLPYLAQGAAMAIEDAVVLSQCIAQTPNEMARAMRDYEDRLAASAGSADAVRAARKTAPSIDMGCAEAVRRPLAWSAMGGARHPAARTIGSISGSPARSKRRVVSHHHRRQPAETGVARRAEQVVAQVEVCRRRTEIPRQRDATILALKLQEDCGIDIVTDGEQARQHFVHGFLETIEGIDFTRKVEMGIRADRYKAMVPTVTDELKLKAGVHAREAVSRALTPAASSNSPCRDR